MSFIINRTLSSGGKSMSRVINSAYRFTANLEITKVDGRCSKPSIALLLKAAESTGEVEITSSGNSMYPIIRDGDVCIFTPVSHLELNRGDIILFVDADGALIGHRF